ncbi:MAG: DUF5320 domain-containing protein [Bacteroidales bacterium]|nr:DUF5320 domain-containing protein [Bacteroidales bacterium]
MPRGDRTGPAGNGPMTGRQMGYCAGNDQAGYTSGFGGFARGLRRGFGFRRGPGFGRGFGRGFGYGRGEGFANANNYDENIPNVSEKTMIENEINSIKDQMSFLEKRLSEIGNKDKES